jgi:hypothetical protein
MLYSERVAVYCENYTEHTDTARTSQETHGVSATKPNRLILFREIVAVYCDNHMGRMQSFSILKRMVQIVTASPWKVKA